MQHSQCYIFICYKTRMTELGNYSFNYITKNKSQILKNTRCKYFDGFGVSYATTFQIHGTSDMNTATQRSGT
jgi:hypothetical protein